MTDCNPLYPDHAVSLCCPNGWFFDFSRVCIFKVSGHKF